MKEKEASRRKKQDAAGRGRGWLEVAGSNSPLLAESLADALLSVPVVQPAALSLPRLRRDMGLKSSFPSG